jgi:hypothetical protein
MAKKAKRTTKNGPVNRGIPFGSMKPSVELQSGLMGIGTLVAKIVGQEKVIIKLMTAFYVAFMKKFPKASKVDVARQFDKSVGFKREEYRTHKTYMTVDNLLRHHPEIRGEKAADRVRRLAAKKAEAQKKRAESITKANRATRLLACIVHQVGIPFELLTVAARVCGFETSEVEGLTTVDGATTDVGMSLYQLVVRTTGVPAVKAVAQSKVKSRRIAETVPTAAEVVANTKSAPLTTADKEQLARQARHQEWVMSHKANDVAVSASVTSKARRNPSANVVRSV